MSLKQVMKWMRLIGSTTSVKIT